MAPLRRRARRLPRERGTKALPDAAPLPPLRALRRARGSNPPREALPPPAPSGPASAKASVSCDAFRRCLRRISDELPVAREEGREARSSACLGSRDASEVEKCLPFEFARDASNGLSLEVKSEVLAEGDVCRDRVWTSAIRGRSRTKSAFATAHDRSQQTAWAYVGGCEPPDHPLVLVPHDELLPTKDSRRGFEVKRREEIGGRFWYPGSRSAIA